MVAAAVPRARDVTLDPWGCRGAALAKGSRVVRCYHGCIHVLDARRFAACALVSPNSLIDQVFGLHAFGSFLWLGLRCLRPMGPF